MATAVTGPLPRATGTSHRIGGSAANTPVSRKVAPARAAKYRDTATPTSAVSTPAQSRDITSPWLAPRTNWCPSAPLIPATPLPRRDATTELKMVATTASNTGAVLTAVLTKPHPVG